MKKSVNALKKFTRKNSSSKPYPRFSDEEESSEPETASYIKSENNSLSNSIETLSRIKLDTEMANKLTLTLDPLKYIEKLSTFDGRREDLYTFFANVDGIIPTLEKYDDESQLMCINILKSKMIGRAKRCIEIHAHLKNWSQIKKLLIDNFGGFESSLQLYDRLRQTIYKGSVIQFYNDIQKNLCELNQKSLQENKVSDIENNNSTALIIFKEKLPVHMRTVLFALKPKTLQEALHELTQAGFVTDKFEEPIKKSHELNKQLPRQTNCTPQRQNNPHISNQNHFTPRNPIHIRPPFSYNTPNPNYKGNNYNPNYKPPSRNYKPTPMEVDPTSSQLRRAQVNHNKETSEDFQDTASETYNQAEEICPLLN